ncbi:tRNA lysidine(34) synthetase TilS [Tenacibaculum finnmarkense]|uniref:tRNA lysidine(34) synthetase TilS n=1 Tax=Tenacibaculum finnmarkense TaxID=2781243 RepID=UPI001E4708D5|nr:tRNA lysidine(34) synthetase TilS [Tenacibaculum finnmarkense]MCD8453337.1 tRNA lysidine(34) synthetase TilS [Tenacibaculum finnmarkense genomovar ulcerans]MCG8804593.1 tRNA lysidine(34) synthetase TilS [Tenacibaculum finnmarkense]MCG8855667.1 tRNA lysidine(34) synthetase TilS [Tenacibaculum finnmarkense]
MLQQLAKHIDHNFLFLKDKKLLIAISGGVDSVVLTHLLHQLKYDISLAHCNFQLRSDQSDLDEKSVKNLGKELEIPVFSTRFETSKYANQNKLSTQLAARKLRYNWFDELLKKHDFDYVLTGHHADDNLETVLINLTRGTGLDGLTGIPAINGTIVRPLLIFSREKIENFALENNIKWREDASNAETKYLRNKIRHQVIPILKELNPSLLKAHLKTTDFLKQSQQIITDKVDEIALKTLIKEDNILKINISEVLKLSNPKAYLYQLLKAYKFTEWDDVYQLIYAQSGKKISSNSHTLLKNRDFLLLQNIHKNEILKKEQFSIDKENNKITNPINLQLTQVREKTSFDKNTIFVDKILLNYPLTIRRWETGDYFYPTGMLGKKKVSKYFKDEKLSLFDKKNIWLLCTNDNKIIWIIGKRQDRRFLPSNEATELLRIIN